MTTGPILHRDFETKSAVDLRKVGAHVYAEHPTTDVWVAVFIAEYPDGKCDNPVIWYPGEPVPQIVTNAAAFKWTFAGHNAAFEQAIDRHIMGPRYGFPIIPDEQINCTLARAAVQSIPLDLARACKALNLPYQKDEAGHRLMLSMCKPRKPRKDEDATCDACRGSKIEEVYDGHGNVLELACSTCGGTGERLLWHDEPAKLTRLTEYCVADVRAEIGLGRALRPLSPSERRVWLLDQKMNNRGVQIDLEFVNVAARVAQIVTKRLDREMREATGGAVAKATEVEKLKDFAKKYGVEFRIDMKTRRNGEEYEAESADKEALQDLLAGELPEAVRRAFELRLEAGKSSVKKFEKFRLQACSDGRARGNLQYHAAGPGRWAGRGIQLHNLIRAGVSKKEGGWDQAFRDIAELDDEMVELIYGPPLDLISRMIRGAVVAAPGNKLIYGDYSNVEARGSVWSAGQKDQVELFARGGKIYEEMGAFIFDLPLDEVIEGHESGTNKLPRFVGKESILGCGYGIGPDKFRRQTKKKARIILPPGVAEKAVFGWREKNGCVVEYWRELEDAAKAAIENPGEVFHAGPFSYRVKGRWLQCRLPSGRIIWYRRPTIEPKSADVEQLDDGEEVPSYRWAIHYWTVNGVTKQWEKTSTWGGKLLQNCIEGLCRDFLARSMLRLDAIDYTPVLSVHDEIISEVPEDFGTVDEFLSVMTNLPTWAPGFPLKAEGGEGHRYAKV